MSHHDIIVSSFPVPRCTVEPTLGNITAPRIPNNRVKIKWIDENIPAYKSLVSPSLSSLRDRWAGSSGPAATSLLLALTNEALNLAAQSTNTVIDLGKPYKAKPSVNPAVREAQKASLAAAQRLRTLCAAPLPDTAAVLASRQECAQARASLQCLTRAARRQTSDKRDRDLNNILDKKPSAIFSAIRNFKGNSSSDIQKLRVSGKVYSGEAVPDGFYDSLSSLKAPDMTSIHRSTSYQRYSADYENILKICSSGLQIPQVSNEDTERLLKSLKADVNDLHSITPRHYTNAGTEGINHFSFILNIIITNINLSSLDYLNSVWAMILHKGHGKDRESDRSYRTISTCPVISKALDKHVGQLFESGWASAQAETQFQGTGSSHELAALLLTETIQFSLYTLKEPLFCILLDAQSAFDKILRELCIRAAFLAGSKGQGLTFIDNRLRNRKTYPEFLKTLMGPISDKLGVEQGGCLSDRLYKLANNIELVSTQRSTLGVNMCTCNASTMTPIDRCQCVHVASIGQADDVALVSNDPHRLQGLVQLATRYATDYHITMVPEKTKLLCYTPRGQEIETSYWKNILPISMNTMKIPFSSEAEHVGILRCTTPGNTPSLLARMSAHNRALYSVLPSGIARHHSGNAAASLRVEKLYGLPVLLSGLAALVLSSKEQDTLNHHHKEKLERLQKLYPRTPAPVVYFLAGTLPASAVLHLRPLAILGMIARLGPCSILHRHGRLILASPPASLLPSRQSWFLQVRSLCQDYSLPDPLYVLANPPSKAEWKKSTKSSVTKVWLEKFRNEAASKPSLLHFRATHMSLSSTSPIWTSCYNLPYETKKATVQARMLSGRYRTCWLRRHWAEEDTGMCRVPGCTGDLPGTLLHMATGQCPGLAAITAVAAAHWTSFLKVHPLLLPLIQVTINNSPEVFLSFLLDPSTQAPVIALAQEYGHDVVDQLCFMSRTWLYALHRERLKKLGYWVPVT